MLQFDRKQQNSVKQLSFNLKINKLKQANKPMFMTEEASQTRERRGNYPLNGAETPDDPYIYIYFKETVFLLHTHIHTQ